MTKQKRFNEPTRLPEFSKRFNLSFDGKMFTITEFKPFYFYYQFLPRRRDCLVNFLKQSCPRRTKAFHLINLPTFAVNLKNAMKAAMKKKKVKESTDVGWEHKRHHKVCRQIFIAWRALIKSLQGWDNFKKLLKCLKKIWLVSNMLMEFDIGLRAIFCSYNIFFVICQ